MTSKTTSGEDKLLPVHSNKNENGSPKKSGFPRFHSKKEKLTPEQEILRMRENQKKKQSQLSADANTLRTGENRQTSQNRSNKPKNQAAANPSSPNENKARKNSRGGKPAAKNGSPLRVIPLGGLGEIGKNMTAIEYEDDIIVIDCGLGFPDDDMLGIDLVIPDTTYLEKNLSKVKGIFLTHGHEDHIGATPYVLRKINVPLYGTKLTLGIVEKKLVEYGLDKKTELRVVKGGGKVSVGVFTVEFIPVNHSIADAVSFAIHTPCGVVIFTGDFKIDSTPIDGEMTDLTRFGELGRAGVTALFCDSTNCERPGFTPSERTVGTSFEHIFEGNKKRVIVATFSSNIHRVQQIIDASVKHERAVCILGRSMINIVTTADKLGYMKIPSGTLIEADELRKFAPEHVTLITTGSQGEAMSALSRMALGTHMQVKLSPEDMVVLSSHPIPGNEKTINNIINELARKQVSVVYDQIAEVHVSGHACQEEIKMIFALTKPHFFMPVHGEYKHLVRNAALAEYAGIPHDRIFISDIGKVFEIASDGKSARLNGVVPAGKILVDGLGVGDVGSMVLRDRKLLSQDGIITISMAVDSYGKYLMSEPQIETRGFIFVKENENLMDEIRGIVRQTMETGLSAGLDMNSLKARVKDETGKFLFGKTKRRPMILPVIIET